MGCISATYMWAVSVYPNESLNNKAMKKKRIFYILTFLIAIGMGACVKDAPIPPPVGDCPPQQQFIQSEFSNDRYQYREPFFNPLNANEFVYYYIDYDDYQLGNAQFQIRTYNLETNENKLLFTYNTPLIEFKWSRKGWIAFRDIWASQIFIMKENGDSLIQKSENVYNYSPCWNYSGSEIYYRYSPTMGFPYYFLSQPLYGNSVDTLLRPNDPFLGYAGRTDVSSKNDLVSITLIDNSLTIATSPLDILDFKSLVNMKIGFNTDFPTGMCWSADGEKIYVSISQTGLFEINAETGAYKSIMKYCWNREYTHISSSPDGKYLIGELVEKYYRLNDDGEAYGDIATNSSIYLIELATLEETKVNIDP